MSAGKVLKVAALRGAAFSDGTVLSCSLAKGILACAFNAGAGVGGALMLPETDSGNSEGLVREWFEKVARAANCAVRDLSCKILAVRCEVGKFRGICQDLKVSVVSNVAEDRELDAFFYTGSGRLRVAAVAGAEIGSQTNPGPFKRRVLVVDDSRTIRQLLTRILSSDPLLEVVGAAELPSQAEQMIEELKPDVITLDINMPEMDGVTLLKRYIVEHPIPTIMISAMSMEEGNLVLDALEHGAVDYIQKPSFEEIDRLAPTIIEKVKTAATIRVRVSRPEVAKIRASDAVHLNQNLLVAIGSSTGGTEALRQFLTKLPAGIPPMMVVQHIPPVFSKAFANRLAELCPFEVKEAEDGDAVRPNRVLIAPGGLQMRVESTGGGYRVKVFDGEPVNRHKPSVDVLFDSVAKEVGKKAIGIIMTGMGRDGAQGLLRMRQAGARSIAQDEASCVVFGMPKEAIKLGAAEVVHPLDEIAEVLTKWLSVSKS